MTDNRTTEHLRALLDERGVEWKSGRVCNNNTSWNVGDSRIIAKELTDGTLLMQQYSRKHFTPEQAIAVTLGSGMCRLHYGEDDDGYDGWYCDECGGWFQAVRRDGHLVEPKHCQECGKAAKR